MLGLRRRLPRDLRPALAPHERVVAWAPVKDGGAVVVSTLGAWVPGRGERLGWHQIHKAAWSGSRLTLIPAVEVSRGDGFLVLADEPPLDFTLTDPDEVPAEIRKRVTKSVAYTAHHPLPGGGVRVVGRRVPGEDGLSWHVRYDNGTDAADPEVVATTAELVAYAAAAGDPDLRVE